MIDWSLCINIASCNKLIVLLSHYWKCRIFFFEIECKKAFLAFSYANIAKIFKKALKKVEEKNVLATKYINNISHEQWVIYAITSLRFDHVTLNLIEIANWDIRGIHKKLVIKMISIIYDHKIKKFYEYTKIIQEWSTPLTLVPIKCFNEKFDQLYNNYIIISIAFIRTMVSTSSGKKNIITLLSNANEKISCNCKIY